MSAEVVVVVEDEDARFSAASLAVEVGRGEAADASPNDDEVISFAGVLGLANGVPERAIAQGVSRVEGTGMAAAHSGERRRIVGGGLLRAGIIGGEKMPRHHGCTRGHCHAVDEIAARDSAMHSQFPVS